jgi:plasmid stability protein
MRGETAETKVSYESKLAEALQLMEAAHKKFDEAEEKLLLAKSLEAESIRTHNAALRSLHDIDDREDQLRRDRISCELE